MTSSTAPILEASVAADDAAGIAAELSLSEWVGCDSASNTMKEHEKMHVGQATPLVTSSTCSFLEASGAATTAEGIAAKLILSEGVCDGSALSNIEKHHGPSKLKVRGGDGARKQKEHEETQQCQRMTLNDYDIGAVNFGTKCQLLECLGEDRRASLPCVLALARE
jgi:hypothetical protein